MRAFIAVVALTLGGLSCTGQTDSRDRAAAVRPAIDSILAAHAEHFRTADIDGLVGAYTQNTVVRPAGMAPARGREALRAAAAEWIAAAPVKSLRYTTEDLSVFGDTAFHVASFTGTVQPRGSADMAIEGSCALVWVHDARLGWKIERSLCNSGPALTGSGGDSGVAQLPAAGRVLLVPARYATIQDAIAAAGAGDRILVDPGTYSGTVTIVGAAKNGLQIIANGREGQVTLRGDHRQRTAGTCRFSLEPICPERAGFFLRDVSGVIIRGFTVTDFGVGPLSGLGEGFLLVNAHRNRIERNVVTRTDMMGITLFNSSENLVERNRLHGNDPDAPGRVGTGCGVHIQNSPPLSPGSAERNVVRDNVMYGNPFAGVMLHQAGSMNQIVSNELRDGGAWGIVNTSTGATLIRGNRITRHTGFKAAGKPRPVGSGVGIGVVTSAGLLVTDNTLSGNSAADIEWDRAGRNEFARNRCAGTAPAGLCERAP